MPPHFYLFLKMDDYKVTVVVCTYNRAGILKHCLHSLVEQNAAKNLFEVIVIDNNSNDKTAEVIQTFVENNINFRMLYEKEQGLSHARNRGFKEAMTNHVAYLDDDAKALRSYVNRMIWVIDNFDFDAFGGRYVPWYTVPRPKWFLDEYGSNGYKLEKIGVLKDDFIDGGVSIFKKRALESLGGFSTDLGMRGGEIAYGEETNLQVKMRKVGLKIGFDPDLIVEHLVSDYKYNVYWFLKSAYANGRYSWAIFELIPTWFIVIRRAINLGYELFVNLIKYTPKLAQRNYFFQNWCIDTIAPALNIIGSLVAAIQLLLNRNACLPHNGNRTY
jgi:glucosyl-dolichyl phosphate glucuronosyltransferase